MLWIADLSRRCFFLIVEDSVPIFMDIVGVGLEGLVHGLRVTSAKSRSEQSKSLEDHED